MDAKWIGIAAALGSAFSWALGSVLFRRLGDFFPPVALTFAKGLLGSLLLGLVSLSLGFQPLEARIWGLLILSGLLGIALGDTLFFLALNRLGAHVVVILFTLGQVLTLLLAVFWLGERPRPLDWLGIALILLGVSLVLWYRIEGEEGRTQLAGVGFGLLSILAMSVSIIIAKEALETAGSIQATLIRMLAGTLGIFLFSQWRGGLRSHLQPLREPKVWGLFLGSVIVVTFGGFWLSLAALAHVDVSIANTLGATEPLFVLPLAAFLLKERISRPAIFGGLASVLGILAIVL